MIPMPLAATHILTAIICADLYRDYVTNHKHLFTLHTIMLAGFFGLLPDIDIGIRMIATYFSWDVPWLLTHGGITHTPFFGLLFLIPAFILWKLDKKKVAVVFFVACVSILVHIFLDWFIGGGAHTGQMLLFPFSLAGYKFHLFSMIGIPHLFEALDAIILLAWLWHEEVRHKISNFF